MGFSRGFNGYLMNMITITGSLLVELNVFDGDLMGLSNQQSRIDGFQWWK